MRWALSILLLITAAVVVGSRFYPQVTSIEVSGNRHYSQQQILELAGLDIGAPFLWTTRTSLRGLLADPWIGHSTVVRAWPDLVAISIRERTPALTDGETTWAFDGTVLPGVSADTRTGLVRVEGWGPPRIAEALELTTVLEGFGLQVISYSPEGFELQLNDGTLFTPSVDALRAQWAPIEKHRGGRLAVYPWGVSRSDD